MFSAGLTQLANGRPCDVGGWSTVFLASFRVNCTNAMMPTTSKPGHRTSWPPSRSEGQRHHVGSSVIPAAETAGTDARWTMLFDNAQCAGAQRMDRMTAMETFVTVVD